MTNDVAVIGAGVSGLSIALQLCERGIAPVRVYERGGVAAGASGVQPGGVRLQWGTRVNCELALESMAFYADIDARLSPRMPVRFERCGYLFVAHTHAALAGLAENVALQRSLGIASRVVTPDEAAELVPGLAQEAIVGASFCADDGYFDRPQSVVQAFADAAVRAGAEIVHDEVLALEPSWTLRLRRGGAVSAAAVVVAAYNDTASLLAPLGVRVPIEEEARYMFFSEPVRERLLEPLIVSAERSFAAKQLADGRVLASYLGARGDPAVEEQDWRRRVRATIQDLVPILQYVSLPLLVEGLYDVTPDHQAVLGRVPGHDGLWVAAGFSGHGFMIAPAVGRMIAAAIVGEPEDEALRVLSLERFARGELVPEPAVV